MTTSWLVFVLLKQTTKKNGKERHYHLGHYLRQRYDAFLSETYSDKEVYVRSTDVDRTLMSAASNLAGLFPPKGDQRWDQSLEWQPIPIHTVPQAEGNHRGRINHEPIKRTSSFINQPVGIEMRFTRSDIQSSTQKLQLGMP